MPTGKKFKRVLIKFSGEVLAGENPFGIDQKTVDKVSDEIISLKKYDLEIGLVFGGGNIFRGLNASQDNNTDRVKGDYMGMLATVINALAVQESLTRKGVKARVMSAVSMPEIAEPMIVRDADEYLNNNEIVIFSAGTGRPFFSTDTGAALRAAEIGAGLMIKGTKVDGVYDKDPIKYPNAKFYKYLTYQKAIEKKLRVMDTTAFSLCQDNNISLVICNMTIPGNVEKVIAGEEIGTLISGGNDDKDILKDTENRMQKSISTQQVKLGNIRTGRANPAMLDSITVDYYGAKTPLKQLANVAAPDARLLVVQVFDRNSVQAVDKAIKSADIGLNPQVEGNLLRLPVPQLNDDRRREFIKFAHNIIEEGKVAVRNIRRDSNGMLKEMEKENDISEDDLHKGMDDVQKLTDTYIKKLDAMYKAKEKDIMEE